MNALLDPINCKEGGVKWALVAHTTFMFSLVAIFTAINIHLLSIAYIDNREFPGADRVIPGPLRYEDILSFETPSIAANVLFVLNQWLACSPFGRFYFTKWVTPSGRSWRPHMGLVDCTNCHACRIVFSLCYRLCSIHWTVECQRFC